jgi:hypothetical protein
MRVYRAPSASRRTNLPWLRHKRPPIVAFALMKMAVQLLTEAHFFLLQQRAKPWPARSPREATKDTAATLRGLRPVIFLPHWKNMIHRM